jgi:hypothetical protein
MTERKERFFRLMYPVIARTNFDRTHYFTGPLWKPIMAAEAPNSDDGFEVSVSRRTVRSAKKKDRDAKQAKMLTFVAGLRAVDLLVLSIVSHAGDKGCSLLEVLHAYNQPEQGFELESIKEGSDPSPSSPIQWYPPSTTGHAFVTNTIPQPLVLDSTLRILESFVAQEWMIFKTSPKDVARYMKDHEYASSCVEAYNRDREERGVPDPSSLDLAQALWRLHCNADDIDSDSPALYHPIQHICAQMHQSVKLTSHLLYQCRNGNLFFAHQFVTDTWSVYTPTKSSGIGGGSSSGIPERVRVYSVRSCDHRDTVRQVVFHPVPGTWGPPVFWGLQRCYNV